MDAFEDDHLAGFQLQMVAAEFLHALFEMQGLELLQDILRAPGPELPAAHRLVAEDAPVGTAAAGEN